VVIFYSGYPGASMGSSLRFFVLMGFAALSGGLSAHEHAPAKAGQDMARMWAETIAREVGTGVSLAADEAGVLWLARMQGGHVRVSRSDDGGKQFSEAVKVNPLPESILADGQNRPKIAVRGGVIAVSWAQALPKLHAGHIRFSRSLDGGRTFSPARTVNDNHDEIGHGFGALAMNDHGQLAVVWLDSRDSVAARKAGQKYLGSSVYYALSDDAGATFAPNRKLADHSCQCCRIGLGFDADGVAVAFWRHVFGSNIRDFALARLEPKSRVVRASEDHWAIDACPHHGGDIAVDAEGGRHLVWFSGNPEKTGLFYRRAEGAHTGAPRAFGDAEAQAGNPAVFALGKSVYVAWREFDGKNYRLLTMRSADRGENWSAAHVVATSAAAADLPLFVAGAAKPLLAWSSALEGVRIFDLGAGQ
jgi:hypothetical protein